MQWTKIFKIIMLFGQIALFVMLILTVLQLKDVINMKNNIPALVKNGLRDEMKEKIVLIYIRFYILLIVTVIQSIKIPAVGVTIYYPNPIIFVIIAVAVSVTCALYSYHARNFANNWLAGGISGAVIAYITAISSHVLHYRIRKKLP